MNLPRHGAAHCPVETPAGLSTVYPAAPTVRSKGYDEPNEIQKIYARRSSSLHALYALFTPVTGAILLRLSIPARLRFVCRRGSETLFDTTTSLQNCILNNRHLQALIKSHCCAWRNWRIVDSVVLSVWSTAAGHTDCLPPRPIIMRTPMRTTRRTSLQRDLPAGYRRPRHALHRSPYAQRLVAHPRHRCATPPAPRPHEMGPTSANCSPARIVLVRSEEGKARLGKARQGKAATCHVRR